jgi:hypothetical protein
MSLNQKETSVNSMVPKIEGKKSCASASQSESGSCTKCGLCLLDRKDKRLL